MASRYVIDFLYVDLDLASTFLDLAETSTVHETKKRNRDHANKAYATVLGFVQRLKMADADRLPLLTKLADLRARIADFDRRLGDR